MVAKEKSENKSDGSQLLGWFFYLAIQFYHHVEQALNSMLRTITFGYITHCPDWVAVIISLILLVVLLTIGIMLLVLAIKLIFKLIYFIVYVTAIIFNGFLDLLSITAAYILDTVTKK